MKNPFLITCDMTGNQRMGYAMCEHVLRDGAEIAFVESATENAIGFVSCAQCTFVGGLMLFHAVCADCVESLVLNGGKVGHA